jgi:uncharacterized protein YceH (UPF0502 family)
VNAGAEQKRSREAAMSEHDSSPRIAALERELADVRRRLVALANRGILHYQLRR